METTKFTPSAFDASSSSYDSVDASHPAGNVLGKDETSTTFARFYMTKGSVAETAIFYSFDMSSIPENAVISRVSCTAKGRMENSSATRAGNNTISLWSGAERIVLSDASKVFGTSTGTYTISTTDFTRSTLNNLLFKFAGFRGMLGVSTSYYMDLFGVSITVEYTIPEEPTAKILYKTGGTWVGISAAYKKVDGVWEKQTDVSSVFDADVVYTSK